MSAGVVVVLDRAPSLTQCAPLDLVEGFLPAATDDGDATDDPSVDVNPSCIPGLTVDAAASAAILHAICVIRGHAHHVHPSIG